MNSVQSLFRDSNPYEKFVQLAELTRLSEMGISFQNIGTLVIGDKDTLNEALEQQERFLNGNEEQQREIF